MVANSRAFRKVLNTRTGTRRIDFIGFGGMGFGSFKIRYKKAATATKQSGLKSGNLTHRVKMGRRGNALSGRLNFRTKQT